VAALHHTLALAAGGSVYAWGSAMAVSPCVRWAWALGALGVAVSDAGVERAHTAASPGAVRVISLTSQCLVT
jgi:alpha-tubulin suppressor-like RCC1 family protein